MHFYIISGVLGEPGALDGTHAAQEPQKETQKPMGSGNSGDRRGLVGVWLGGVWKVGKATRAGGGSGASEGVGWGHWWGGSI